MAFSQEEVEEAFLKALQGGDSALRQLCPEEDFNERFAIYQTSILGTLQQTLYKIFKPLETLLGIDAFQELCFRYAQSHFSKKFNLNRYGEDFDAFAMTAPYAKELPYLGEFIQFCYLWQQVYLQPESEAALITFNYPVYEIWQRCQPEFKGDPAIENWDGPFSYTIQRQNDKVLVIKKPASSGLF